MADLDIDAVTGLLREAAADAILPRFRALADGAVTEKAPGELVTVADRDAERIITAGLLALTPGAVVVGEEASAADPALLAALGSAPEVWLVDPLDGTRNFVAGSPDYAVMAAYVRDGETVASWILQPSTGTAYVAERGGGAWRDGERLYRTPAAAESSKLEGMVLTRFLSPGARQRVEAGRAEFGAVGEGTGSAGLTYPALATGGTDFAAFHRTLPWDHAPGILLLHEAHGLALRLDGAQYTPAQAATGLLAAADPRTWALIRERLL